VQRLIELEGCLNFRDLGGYPTADGGTLVWRRIYRSDGLHRLTSSDCARIRDELRVTDLIDLRSSAELAADGRGLLENEPLAFHHVPLFDGNTGAASFGVGVEQMTLADRYLGLAEVAKPAIARVVTIVAEADGGTVYHCAAGKDRTGVISAILLSALGVSDELIVADYALTQQNLDAIVARLGESEAYKTMLDALPPDTLHAEPQTMVVMLEQLCERYGSVEGYLESANVGEDVLTRLRDSAIG
jgi:protein-tyrosine phosphatase